MTIIYGLIILGLIVFIHELGHYIAAKTFGINVESFSIGMGPILFHKKICNTDWRISLFPFGGYCGMKGEQDFIKAYEENCSVIEADSDSLYGIHPLKRAIIAFSGPFFNLILALISFFIIGIIGYSYYSASSTISLSTDKFPEYYSPAKEAGIKTGDTILKIDDKIITDFSDIQNYVSMNPNKLLNITVNRNNEVLTFSVQSVLDKKTGAGKIGIMSNPQSIIKKESKKYGFLGSVKYSFSETFSILHATIKGILSLFNDVEITNAVSGPARITTMLGETVKFGFSEGFRTGLSAVLNFIAIISISLFLMNLLPIPILDGGLILFSIIESIFRITISPKIRYRIQYIGIIFIVFIFIIAMIGDFKYFFGVFK